MEGIIKIENPFIPKGKYSLQRNVIGWVITVLNILMAINSSYFFLGKLKVGIEGWLMLNTCAPSIILFAAGFILANRKIIVAGSLCMLRYGTLGLFVFGWSGMNLVVQISHLIMTAGVCYVAADLVRSKQYKDALWGLALGACLLLPMMYLQSVWFEAHPKMLEQLFGGNFSPP
jgi:hypothetical protein